MYCYYCNHPLNIPQPVFKHGPRTGNVSIHGGVVDVKCIQCGAVYEITAIIKKPTTKSLQEVDYIANRPDPPSKAKGPAQS